MRAWVAKRRDCGTLLGEPARLGEGAEAFELLVVEVTDQGMRRPTKVARMVRPGERLAVAELIAPRLVWFKKWDFVLSGVERAAGGEGLTMAGQSWLCKLQPATGAIGFRARHTHKDGMEIARRMIMDRYASESKGQLLIEGAKDSTLGRYTVCSHLLSSHCHAASPGLLDTELDWMSEERFSLSGFREVAAYGDRPARLLRHGWLCEFDIAELSDEDSRPLRGARPVR